MRVVIVGGGVTGLVASYLLEQAGVCVDLVEKSGRLGGNAVTREVVVGDQTRWVDLGVNDFNAPTYPQLNRLLSELGVEHRPLDDSASFYFRDGGTLFTLDGRWSTAMPSDLRAEYARFSSTARCDFDNDPSVHEMSVDDYLTSRQFSRDLAHLVIFPRVNAMYFANDVNPADMPFAAAMTYYRRQEGTTQTGADRRYFVGGSVRWIEALAKQLRASTYLDTTVQVQCSDDGVTAHFGDGRSRTYDAALLTCDPAEILATVTAGMDSEVMRRLATFRYSNTVSVAHAYSGLLPPNPNAWRTYNITIRDGTPGLRPYSMTYWENFHQNDARDHRYGRIGQTPNIFVTVNPLVPIPEHLVLRSDSGEPAMATFRHVVIDFATLRAQRQLQQMQGRNRLFLAGGWLSDVGLHESCIESAHAAVDELLGARRSA